MLLRENEPSRCNSNWVYCVNRRTRRTQFLHSLNSFETSPWGAAKLLWKLVSGGDISNSPKGECLCLCDVYYIYVHVHYVLYLYYMYASTLLPCLVVLWSCSHISFYGPPTYLAHAHFDFALHAFLYSWRRNNLYHPHWNTYAIYLFIQDHLLCFLVNDIFWALNLLFILGKKASQTSTH